MRETVTVTMVGVLIGIVVVTLLVQFFCLEILMLPRRFPPPWTVEHEAVWALVV
jgi:hypothetical protein